MTDNKALEALENVKMALARHLARQVGYVPPDSVEKFRNALEADTDLQIIAAALVEADEIKKRAEKVKDVFVREIESSKDSCEAEFAKLSRSIKIALIDFILKGEPE